MTTSIIMKKQNETLELLKNPFFVFIVILGSPYYVVHKIVQWLSVKTDKSNNNEQLAIQ